MMYPSMHLLDYASFLDVWCHSSLSNEEQDSCISGMWSLQQDWKESNISCFYMHCKAAAKVQQVDLVPVLLTCLQLAEKGMQDNSCHDCRVACTKV